MGGASEIGGSRGQRRPRCIYFGDACAWWGLWLIARETASGAAGRALEFAGPAVTALCQPGDNLMMHRALRLAQPGDVLDAIRAVARY